ncbi:MAG: ABC transporter ATP-binding protein [Oscillochloris sp.]|nr:ABC transporter ATP-binding protein [Oscillochloris sp.]
MPRTLRIIWAAAPLWTVAWAAILVIQGLLPAGLVFLTSQLVDGVVGAVSSDGSWERFEPVLRQIVLVGGLMVLAQLIEGLAEWVRTAQAELVRDHISRRIHTKSIAVDLAFYETPAHHDRLHRARSDAGSRSLALLESIGSLLQNGITMLVMMVMLIPFGIWLPLVLLLSTLPALYVVMQTNRRYHQWWEQSTAEQRWAHYYETMLTSSNTAAELRLFKLGSYFQAAFQDIRRQLRGQRIDLARNQAFAHIAARVAALLIISGAMVWMVWRTTQSQVTLGELILFYQIFNWGQGIMHGLLGSVGRIYSNSLFLGNLFEFLDLQPQITDPAIAAPTPQMVQSGVRFHQVTFRYPGSERIALHNFDLDIPAGKSVAIVGANGAGKSTLIKLLCRFYDPEEGRIAIDGTDIRALPVEQLRRLITVLFQMPVGYHATAAENIALGDMEARPDAAAIEAAARSAGAHEVIARLPRQYTTMLGKAFADGTDLSGGEWQRVALARAFLRQAQIVVLDEPTSFMDSWAEAEWLDRFQTLVAGRTAVIITHRFTTAMRADFIHVMEQGRIVESGTHAELLARGGLYALSWEAQMRAGAEQSAAPISFGV